MTTNKINKYQVEDSRTGEVLFKYRTVNAARYDLPAYKTIYGEDLVIRNTDTGELVG